MSGGQRHHWSALLCLATLAVIFGARSHVAYQARLQWWLL